MQRRLRYTGELVVLAGVYFLAARAGLKLDAVAGFAALVWPPTGIALAALVIRGQRLWPGVLLGAFLANVLNGASIPVAVGIGVGNTLEAMAGAYVLRRIPGFRPSLDRLMDVFGLIIGAAAASTTISATIGVGILYLGGVVAPAGFAETWRAWWLGDLIGALLVAPVLLVWSIRPRLETPDRFLEAGALAVSVVAVSLLVFGDAPSDRGSLGEGYLFFPLLIWAALRFGQRGSVTTAFIISVIAVWGTVIGRGPFVQPQLYQSLLGLQAFLSVTAATFLILGASISERRIAVGRLESAIAEQNRLLAERDAAHGRLVAVLEQTPLAIGIVDGSSGRFIFANDEVQRLTGRRPSPGSTLDLEANGWIGFHPDGTPVAPDEWPIARALHKAEVVRNEVIRFADATGRPIELMINAAPVRDGQNAVVAAVVIFWDVTAQRQAEEELRRAHDAEAQANRAKSDFLAVMSHELRTPLNAIGGHLQLIEMEVHGPVTEAQRDALGRVQRSQRHLLALINDLLNLTRIETGHVEYELANVPLEPLVAEVKAMVEPLLSSSRLSCKIGESPYAVDPPLMVCADREKAQQILMNLFSNAIKFTPAGGRITVDMGSCTEASTMAAVSVSDSGSGIPEAKLESIFEPFVQLRTRPATPSVGLGLGLAISRDLARGMGGDLKVASILGKGATFTLLLPKA